MLKVAGSIFMSLDFSLGPNHSRPCYGPGVDSGCSRNEYQESFPGGKGRPAHKADNINTPSVVRLSKKYENLDDPKRYRLHSLLRDNFLSPLH
jgi:hypothetical protein